MYIQYNVQSAPKFSDGHFLAELFFWSIYSTLLNLLLVASPSRFIKKIISLFGHDGFQAQQLCGTIQIIKVTKNHTKYAKIVMKKIIRHHY
jgi:hypothetical protein